MFISVQDIAVRVGDQVFFEHTSWEIERDQHWAILGPNGSGKTVLAKALAHQIPLVRGQILYYFDGPDGGRGRPYPNRNEVLTFSAEAHRDFLRQFASYHQARWQSFEGEEAPAVGSLLELRSLFSYSPFEVLPPHLGEGFQRKREEVLHLFGLEPLLERKAHLLSHGESRKVFLARLLLRSPKLLILDDPFTGLDEASRGRFRRAVETLLEKQEPTLLLITSRPEDIPAGVDQLLLVNDGRVVSRQKRPEFMLEAAAPPAQAEAPSAQHSADILAPPGDFERLVRQYSTEIKETSPDYLALDNVIQLDEVSVVYGKDEVLKRVRWTVRPGERWALLGANGAGKTTLLSLILADNPQAYSNDIYLFGRRRGSGESIWEIKRRIGWVSPELQVFYEKSNTCRDVVASGFFDSVGLYHQYSEKQAAAVKMWMQVLGIERLAELPFDTLSAGQQRLALLGRALVKNPPLLVLDEPCQGLDGEHRSAFIQVLDRICARVPITMIYVTHYREELPVSITHRLRLDAGQVAEVGPLSAVE